MKRLILLLTVAAILLTLTACNYSTVYDLLDEPEADLELELAEEDPGPDASDWDITVSEPEDIELTPEEDAEPEAEPEIEPEIEPEAEPEPVAEPEAAPEPEPIEVPEAEPELILPESEELTSATTLDEDGYYYKKDDVALYIYTYGCLPDNYITKKQAQKLGWEGGKLEPYAPGKAIGGDRFGNYEGQLPKKKGRTYTECDIDTKGKKRGAKRIIFSNDGLIYYTDDHYESFELLYGEP